MVKGRVCRVITPSNCLIRRCRRSFSSQASINAEVNTQLDASEQQTKVQRRVRHTSRKNVFSGIQPTGVPHLGNYLGALREWKRLQDEKVDRKQPKNHQLIFSIVDLHALTHEQRPDELFQRRRETLASLLAIGLDPKHSIIYYQSSVAAHAQLMWYLSTVASTGYLSRMTQWKSKIGVSEDATLDEQNAREKLRLGLFSYPVLQAADILLYNTDLVPVGEDQQQHVEFARNLANSFNARYMVANQSRPFFKLPKASISPAKRIMSLRDPTAKMSKSHPDPGSRILISDSADTIRSRIKKAVTDSTEGISYDPEKRPGVSNLIDILKHVMGLKVSSEEIASQNANHTMRAFKEHVADEVVVALAGFKDRYMELMDSKNTELDTALATGRRAASARAGSQLARVERLMGLQTMGQEVAGQNADEDRQKLAESNREAIQREQEEEEAMDESEPDVLPQKEEGVNIPIAS